MTSLTQIVGRVIPVHQGDFDAEKQYGVLDEIFYEGVTYRVRNNVVPPIGTLPTDTDYFVKVSSTGAKVISASSVDNENGTFSITFNMEDTSTFSVVIPNVQGEQGVSLTSVDTVNNENDTLTFTFNFSDDSTSSVTTPSLRGPIGPMPTIAITEVTSLDSNATPTFEFQENEAGTGYNGSIGIPKGNKGTSINDVIITDNGDYTYTFTFKFDNDATVPVTTSSIRGAIGETPVITTGDIITIDPDDDPVISVDHVDGNTYTLSIGFPVPTVELGTITTGAPGSNGSITNVGTDRAQIWDIVLPAPVDGEMAGPDVSVNDSIAVFDGTSGNTVKDGGKKISDLATYAQGLLADSSLQPEDIGSSVQAHSTILDNTTASFTTILETKLENIAENATANDTDSNLKNRANHTGEQEISTVTGLQSALDSKATSSQGLLADSSLQPEDIGSSVQAHSSVLDATTASFTTTLKSTIDNLGTASTKNTGTGNGNVPILGSDGKLSTSILPDLAITDTYLEESEVAMLALSAQKGDVCIRSDVSKTFMLSSNSPSTLADWKELPVPASGIQSVAGLTAANIVKSDLLTALNVTDGADKTSTELPSTADGKAILNSTYSSMKTQLNIVIGTDIQAHSSILDGTTASFTTTLESKLNSIAAGATANTGTVTSVGVSVPTGFTASPAITTSGTIVVAYASGYEGFTTVLKDKLDNVGTMANRAITISSSDPSGGADGDVWFKV